MGRKRKSKLAVVNFSSESDDDGDERPRKVKKKQPSSIPTRRKTRAASRTVNYSFENTEESDIEVDEMKQESSDYVLSKSADSTEERSEPDESGGDEEVDESSNIQDDEPMATPSQRNKTSTPRSSERLKNKKRKRFRIPSKDEIFKDMDTHSPTKSLWELQPRKLVNNFTKVYNSYNHDRYFTSGESSVEDFIDDESSEEERRKRQKKHLKKTERERRASRVIRPESDSSDSEREKQTRSKINRSRIDSSDSDAPVQARRRNQSMIVDSDSGLEDMNSKESMCSQIDGAGDRENDVPTIESGTLEQNSNIVEPADGTKVLAVSTVLGKTSAGALDPPESSCWSTGQAGTVAENSVRQETGDTTGVLSTSDQKTPLSETKAPEGSAVTIPKPFHETGRLNDLDSDEDNVTLLVEVDSEDSLEKFIVNSDEDVENVEPEGSDNSEVEISFSGGANRQFIASDSESDEDWKQQDRKRSKRAQLMEKKRQAHRDKFSVFRKATRKVSS